MGYLWEAFGGPGMGVKNHVRRLMRNTYKKSSCGTRKNLRAVLPTKQQPRKSLKNRLNRVHSYPTGGLCPPSTVCQGTCHPVAETEGQSLTVG